MKIRGILSSTLTPPALDLTNFARPQRAEMWSRSAGTFFPGMSVSRPPVDPVAGSIQAISMGPGRLCSVLSPPVHVSYAPSAFTDASPMFSIMLQLEGFTAAAQGRRVCRLNRGDFCLIDNLKRFEIEVTGAFSRVTFLQFPRHSVLSRQPGLEHRTAERFGAAERGAGFLLNVLLNLLDAAPYLNEEQKTGALAAIVQLLAVPKLPATAAETDRRSRRIQAALAFIDERYSDSTLTASEVAQGLGVCRRRLDQVLLESVGTSLSAQIWTRRLTQAASDLLDTRFANKTVTQIAFGAGFEDGAHFTRAFKRKYQCTPSEWRLRAGVSVEKACAGAASATRAAEIQTNS